MELFFTACDIPLLKSFHYHHSGDRFSNCLMLFSFPLVYQILISFVIPRQREGVSNKSYCKKKKFFFAFMSNVYENVKLEKSWELESNLLITNLQYFVFATHRGTYATITYFSSMPNGFKFGSWCPCHLIHLKSFSNFLWSQHKF